MKTRLIRVVAASPEERRWPLSIHHFVNIRTSVNENIVVGLLQHQHHKVLFFKSYISGNLWKNSWSHYYFCTSTTAAFPHPSSQNQHQHLQRQPKHQQQQQQHIKKSDEDGDFNRQKETPLSEYVKTWLVFKNDFLHSPPGIWQQKPQRQQQILFRQTQELIKAIRGHDGFNLIFPNNRSQVIFQVLDRLCLECQKSAQSRQQLVLDQDVLVAALVTWRDEAFQRMATIKTATYTQKPQHGYDDSITTPIDTWSTTDTVRNRVEHYLNQGFVEPSPVYFNIILHAMAMVEPRKEAPFQAERWIYQRMLHHPNHHCHPDVTTIHAMIELWAKSGLPESAQRAEAYLQAWKDQRRYHGHGLVPSSSNLLKNRDVISNMYCAVMEAHARCPLSPHEMAFARIQELQEEMKRIFCSHQHYSIRVYNRIAHALTLCHQVDAARALLDYLLVLQQQQSSSPISDNKNHKEFELPPPKPDPYLFSIVLNAYARAGRADEATALFQTMERLWHETGHDKSYKPNVQTRLALLWSYAKVGDTVRAESTLQQLLLEWQEKGHTDDDDDVDGNTLQADSVNACLAAFAEGGNVRIIENMIQKLTEVAPQLISASTYNKLLGAYAAKKDVQKAQDLFQFMSGSSVDVIAVKPDMESWFNLILAHCNAGNVERAEALLRDYCHNHHRRGYRNTRSNDCNDSIDNRMFGVVIEAYAKTRHSYAPQRATAVFDFMKEMGVAPAVAHYTSLMFAWASLGFKGVGDPGKPVQRLFDEMMQQWREVGNALCRPDELSFNGLLSGLTRSSDSDAMERAEQLFHKEMEHCGVKQNRIHYTTLMSGWARQGRPDKVESLFQDMKRQSTYDSNLIPDGHCHLTRLQAWSRAGDPQAASSALADWISDCESEGRPPRPSSYQKPDTQAFNAVLQAWLRSNRPDAANKAEQGLNQMMTFVATKRFGCQPDVFSFTTVISAYAKSDASSQRAGAKALELFQALKRLGQENKNDVKKQPTPVSYAQVIIALAKGSDRNSATVIQQLLHELQIQPCQFWSETRSNELLNKVERAIGSSSLPERHDLIQYLRHQVVPRVMSQSNRRKLT